MGVAPINHKMICDSFGELSGRTVYLDRKMPCGKCGTTFLFTGEAQKYVFEKRSVPVSKAYFAAYCQECHSRKAIENRKAKRARAANPQLEPAMLLFEYRQKRDVSILFAYIQRQLSRFDSGESSFSALERLLKELQKAQKQSAGLPEALYWEGRIYQSMRRPGIARARYRAFIKQMNRPKPLRPLWKDAEKRLARMASSGAGV